MNFPNSRLSRGLSSFDVTHNFVASYNWSIPFDRAFRALPTRLTRGWNIAGITHIGTGFPVRIHQCNGDLSLVGSSSTDEPYIVGQVITQDPHKSGPNGANTYVLPAAFAAPPRGSF